MLVQFIKPFTDLSGKKPKQYYIGDKAKFDDERAQRLISRMLCVRPMPEPKPPVVETATAEPKAETAEVTPKKGGHK